MMASAPSPREWGWKKKPGGGWSINWTTLPEASEACRELLRCGCKNGCRGRCKYQKAALPWLYVSAVDSALRDTVHREQFTTVFIHSTDLQLDYNKLWRVPLPPTNTDTIFLVV